MVLQVSINFSKIAPATSKFNYLHNYYSGHPKKAELPPMSMANLNEGAFPYRENFASCPWLKFLSRNFFVLCGDLYFKGKNLFHKLMQG